MAKSSENVIANVLEENEQEILEDWMKEQLAAVTLRSDLMSEEDLRAESAEFLKLFASAVQSENCDDLDAAEWSAPKTFLAEVSRNRAKLGFSVSETAMFVFSLKQPLFTLLRQTADTPEELGEQVWSATVILDKLGLFTTETYAKTREELVLQQQEEILELSTPVVELWDEIVSVPLIGTLDSARTQAVMENLLQTIADTGSRIAIIDITGVPAVDTQVAQHLLKTVAATRLMGAECIISGIRPGIAQTIVTLGLTINVPTRPTLAGALAEAFKMLGVSVGRADR
ncbi:MAG: STAS domain-containing protein [Phycisphaerae bacterium]|jgi:rsbT co-antagonist protein RsbR|nr:STAS domain-containing protein [Phycisphaerae bacterium]